MKHPHFVGAMADGRQAFPAGSDLITKGAAAGLKRTRIFYP